ncbi:MerR family transcriptional regulator [Paenibacillus sp. BSR1-1]|uniref:MerR family transcriptional regulator n=1 Tax=Paenibacillus sp. BSR1-1 TaxID=3020845 RepID=UPI0025AF222B|nr:MerR family transcriptional regulator [Paenibacillus sp. BSR1-1]MDN3018732.1 MerR family transcriptional regulator [Paenibacillus sp. BSR1-1]
MNTSEAAKLLGVSTSTIQRWVKQLDLPMERNERGHYHFNDKDIKVLQEIHEQLQSGTLIQEIVPVKEKKIPRKGIVNSTEKNETFEKLLEKVNKLEMGLHAKADSVASYQLLQHRREIEELQQQIKELTQLVETLQTEMNEMKRPPQIEKPLVLDNGKVKRKKKSFVSSLLGL